MSYKSIDFLYKTLNCILFPGCLKLILITDWKTETCLDLFYTIFLNTIFYKHEAIVRIFLYEAIRH